MSAQGLERSAPVSVRLHFSVVATVAIAVALLFAIVPFTRAIGELYDVWSLQPEYSHGILIPVISVFLIWRERRWLSETPFRGSWWGVVLVAVGLAMWGLGQLSATKALTYYAFLVVLYGMVLALTGGRVFARLWMPLLMLLFMVPFPAFVTSGLSLQLQLLSSSIGVSIIRLAGISVFVEGNVIDLGSYKLQVAEACDGLRYLFPLMTLGFIIAYFFRGATWKRTLLFLASIPIAISMNVIRIGIIGITVDRWGTGMAEGFLHEFQGWAVFMVSTAMLLLVAMALTRIGSVKTSWRDTFQLDSGPPRKAGGTLVERTVPAPFVGTAVLAAAAMIVGFALPDRAEAVPTRPSFSGFPAALSDWQGRQDTLEPVYLDVLKLDDYLLANYRKSGTTTPVNLYVAWYDSQREGASAHSPRSCLPGGGWQIRSFDQRALSGVTVQGQPIAINRVLIELGSNRQIVYYWFQQRGRTVTNEYLVKWFIFWDALVRNRTDGALVRLTVPLTPKMTEAEADAILADFARKSLPSLSRYIPD